MLDKIPHLSIITVCLNSADFIESAINSIHTQHYKNREHIVVDGGSTDGTVDILKKFQEQQILNYVSEPDGGIYEAMNKGIKLATGKWIYFLGSDDIFFDNGVLERLFCSNEKDAQIIYGNVKYLYSGTIYDGPFDHQKISLKNICHQAMFVQKSLFEQIGLFNTKYKVSADHEFNLRWMGLNVPSIYVPETIAVYNEKGFSGQVSDHIFNTDFDQLLIDNNIISVRSFSALKKRYLGILYSTSFKTGKLLLSPFTFLKNKLRF